jgi:hypothetical protein
MQKILKQLLDLFEEMNMTKEEISAFSKGISNLPIENQVELFRIFNYDKNLIYPTFVHYMAKRRAKDTGIGWEDAVEAEIKFLDNHIEGKIVGNEVRV